MLIEHLMLEM